MEHFSLAQRKVCDSSSNLDLNGYSFAQNEWKLMGDPIWRFFRSLQPKQYFDKKSLLYMLSATTFSFDNAWEDQC